MQFTTEEILELAKDAGLLFECSYGDVESPYIEGTDLRPYLLVFTRLLNEKINLTNTKE